ncbi:MAG: HAMP domain-containing histidine kinase [bacterium]|nr:HAMP domain-containing histidine kinase [bacterium]
MRDDVTAAAQSQSDTPAPAPAHGPARPLAARSETAPPAAVQERVLAEVGHELGNFFHKLYYWAEYLQERRAGHGGDTTATQMLGRTVHNLEEFLRTTLDFFRPITLTPMSLSVTELVAGVLGQLRAQADGISLTVTDPGAWEGHTVVVDPVRLPPVFLLAMRRLAEQAAPGSRLRVSLAEVEQGGRIGLEVAFALATPGNTTSLFQTAAAGIEWAVAERVVALHGGALTEHDAGQDERRIVVFLPFHA